MKFFIFSLYFILSTSCLAASPQLNLDFENIESKLPKGWNNFGDSANYAHSIDKELFQSDKYSVSLEFKGDKAGFRAWSYTIPAKYQGNKVTLKGFIKTEHVSDGWAGLWMRIDPNVSFDNMKNRGISGTTDWHQYEITLDLKPSNAKDIVIGGLLVGKGKMWVDNLELFIDDQPLEKVPLKTVPFALKDIEFDNGSDISIPKLNKVSLNNLELLGRVWGFLKYHHPAIASGSYNWDYELFRVLPKYLNTQSTLERDTILSGWIESLGNIKPCTECKSTNPKSFISPDLSWVTHYDISIALQKKLTYIYSNRSQNGHFYMGSYPSGNPKFKNENPYSNMPFPDDGFRLLSVFRYWNMIQYYFPYKHLIEKDWNKVLTEHIGPFINAKSELEYEIAALKLIGEVQDTHANLWGGINQINKKKGRYYPSVHTRVVEGKLVVTDFYTEFIEENIEMSKLVGLNIGDVIIAIDGVTTDKLIEERLPYYPASNYSTKLRDIAPQLLRSNKNAINVTFLRDNKTKTMKLTLFEKDELHQFRLYRKELGGKSFKLLNDQIGYVTLKNIKKEDIEVIKKKFINTKGIIIDIRNYPSTFVPFSLGSFFVSETTPFVKFTKVNMNNPGEFTFTSSIDIPKSKTSYEGKLVVLVNEITQSQAEYTSMALKAGSNTTIIGSTTAGADGNVSTIFLPGNLKTMISGIGIYYPDGTETQKIGIVPDIKLAPTIKGIKMGKDELLEKAIEIIQSE
jgi:C-terminal processing protease CtpA/Prc